MLCSLIDWPNCILAKSVLIICFELPAAEIAATTTSKKIGQFASTASINHIYPSNHPTHQRKKRERKEEKIRCCFMSSFCSLFLSWSAFLFFPLFSSLRTWLDAGLLSNTPPPKFKRLPGTHPYFGCEKKKMLETDRSRGQGAGSRGDYYVVHSSVKRDQLLSVPALSLSCDLWRGLQTTNASHLLWWNDFSSKQAKDCFLIKKKEKEKQHILKNWPLFSLWLLGPKRRGEEKYILRIYI